MEVLYIEEWAEYISLDAPDGFPAEGEISVVKGGHSPEEEAKGHNGSFAGSDSAVADERIEAQVRELQDLELFVRERHF